jgi:hypothetical protein
MKDLLNKVLAVGEWEQLFGMHVEPSEPPLQYFKRRQVDLGFHASETSLDSTEIIAFAANIARNGQLYIVSRPGRHHNCSWAIHADGSKDSKQGFVTSTGRFVNRYTALIIAKRMGQMNNNPQWGNSLYSENIWSNHNPNKNTDTNKET